MRGLNAIVRNFSSSWGRDETSLEKACKAGALCVVVRNANWRPEPGQANIPAMLVTVDKEASPEQPHNTDVLDIESAQLISTPSEAEDATTTSDTSRARDLEQTLTDLRPIETILTIYRPTWLKETQDAWWTHFDTLWGRNIVDPTLKAIHGTYQLPPGYSFSILPRDTIVQAEIRPTTDGDFACEIAASYSILKVLASIFQLLAATYTLWLHRGGQMSRWGFASFSFVPVPYAIMSLINGVSHLFSPDYPAIYMVSSNVMEEAKDAGGSFDGVIGHVVPYEFTNDDAGYGSGFDSNWKGLTPGVLRRTILSLFNSAKGKKKQVRELVVYEQSLPERTQIEHDDPQTIATDDHNNNHGLALMFHSTASPVLFVEQSPNVREKFYLVRAAHRSENAIESTAFRLPKISLKWVRFGLVGISVLYWITALNLVVHPIKTYRSIEEQAHLLTQRVQTFFTGVRTVANETASNTALKGSLMTRIKALLLAPSADDIDLSESLREDNLPRISFRACEGFKRRGDADPTSSIRTNRAQIPRFIVQSVIATIISSFSILVIGLMSDFNHGSSSKTERIILMTWLAVGVVVGLLIPFLNINDAFTLLVRIPQEVQALARTRTVIVAASVFLSSSYITALITLLVCLPWSVFVVPIWGFVIVGQQLAEWGACALA
ncbi:hypothetical protein SLS60_012072 [Paraconiothyrium brasiliense]|uniref:Uncharacterized protein n=1 Tax=Paraconiothyrium brasiliense TaxID=300254 RepID=A0ABR3QH17_9PLEO